MATDMKLNGYKMELIAYHKWLLRESKGDRERLAQLLLHDLMEDQNPMAFDLLEKTGEQSYNSHTLLKAADLLLKAEKEQDK
jgi:hypothetical protein